MQFDWSPLREELKRWRRKDMILPVWWRDDDAVAPSDQLRYLIEISEEVDVPVHLAIIPREATKALANIVAEYGNLIPVVHGWSHTNHQPEGDPKGEFGETRDLSVRREEAAEGLRRLTTLMGDRAVPMFVPPWNRVPDSFLPDLAELGFKAISTCHPRSEEEPVTGLKQINTHIDPLYWKPARLLSNPDLIIDRAVTFLKQRRQGKADNAEPFGYLTHHLAHTPEVWEFTRQYWLEIMDGPTSLYRCE